MLQRGSATSKALLLVVVIIAAAMLWALWPEGDSFEQAIRLDEWEQWDEIKAKIEVEVEKVKEEALSAYEKAQIEAWLVEEDLNRYGDLKDTAYAGGTPLFIEATNEVIDRFDYIIQNHPDKPWASQ